MSILAIWEKYTFKKADETCDFFDAGGDSLGAINLIVEIQKQYNIDISVEKFMRNPTLSFLLDVTKAEA